MEDALQGMGQLRHRDGGRVLGPPGSLAIVSGDARAGSSAAVARDQDELCRLRAVVEESAERGEIEDFRSGVVVVVAAEVVLGEVGGAEGLEDER